MNTMQVTEELAGIIAAMRVDGYEMEVAEASSGSLSLTVRALEDACEDCLAPPEVMSVVVSGALRGHYKPEQIAISQLPVDQ